MMKLFIIHKLEVWKLNPFKYFNEFGIEAILIIDFGEEGLKVLGHALLIINFKGTNYLIT